VFDGELPVGNLLLDTSGVHLRRDGTGRRRPSWASSSCWRRRQRQEAHVPRHSTPLPVVSTVPARWAIWCSNKAGGRFGRGVAFRLVPPIGAANHWTETVLHLFSGGRDGGAPSAPPFQDTAGSLYGVVGSGGSSDRGGVYKITPPAIAGGRWSQAIVYSFRGPDGSRPNTQLSTDGSGKIYGATAAGELLAGTVFALRP
jgi:hypothetical protein